MLYINCGKKGQPLTVHTRKLTPTPFARHRKYRRRYGLYRDCATAITPYGQFELGIECFVRIECARTHQCLGHAQAIITSFGPARRVVEYDQRFLVKCSCQLLKEGGYGCLIRPLESFRIIFCYLSKSLKEPIFFECHLTEMELTIRLMKFDFGYGLCKK